MLKERIHAIINKMIQNVILFTLSLIAWVRSFSKMLPYVKFAEDKVLVFVILSEKMRK